MSPLKIAVILLAFLCCNYHVQSNPTILTTEYDFGNQRLIIGKNHINKAKWLYALCDITDDERSAECLLHLVTYAFDDEARVHRCPVSLATEFGRGRLDILGIEFMSEDKAIFTWEDLNYSRTKHAEVTIEIIDMLSCDVTMQKITVDTRDDLISQVFIMPFVNGYTVAFKNREKCREFFCKMTVYEFGSSSQPARWFRCTKLIRDLQSFNDGSDMHFLATEHQGLNKHYFFNQRYSEEILIIAPENPIYWSFSNGINAMCDQSHCVYYTHDSEIEHALPLQFEPTKYAGLYNFRNWEGHLAVICSSNSNNYRIIEITLNGYEGYSFELEGLPCSHNLKYFTSKFYQKSSTEYCLSLFYSQYNHVGRYTFANYCFTI